MAPRPTRSWQLPARFLPGIALLLFLTVLPALTGPSFHLDPEILARAEQEYGAEARKRLLAWQGLIQEKSRVDELEKLRLVNGFFNRLAFIDDAIHWHEKDHWATPVEFLASGGGDCEDFALAKYFTLKFMGVAEEKMNMTYVKALKIN